MDDKALIAELRASLTEALQLETLAHALNDAQGEADLATIRHRIDAIKRRAVAVLAKAEAR